LTIWAQPAQAPSVQGTTPDDCDHSWCTLEASFDVDEFESTYLLVFVAINIATNDPWYNISDQIRVESALNLECYMARIGYLYTDERGTNHYTFSSDRVCACYDATYYDLGYKSCVNKHFCAPVLVVSFVAIVVAFC